MLTLFGSRTKFCDGVSRRSFLKLGALAAGGLTLADLLRAEALAAGKATGKSVINIYLAGGPSHMDTFDLKPEAPKEFRGEFQPIPTNVPGLEICEHFPLLAKLGHAFSVVRSISGLRDEHDPSQSDSGWSEQSLRTLGGRPGVGAVISKVCGAVQGAAPTFVSLNGFGKPGFLGSIHGPYRPDGEGRSNLRLQGNISLERLGDRTRLLEGFGALRREADHRGMMTAMDAFNQRAFSVITSSTMIDALNIDKEDPRVVERYGVRRGGFYDGNSMFLLSRRLIEAGVRCVSFSWGSWDTHGDNFNHLRRQLPALDVGLATLLEDLEARRMLDDTIVLMSGEFGRTPRINGGAGRDHWPQANFFFIAGGGFKHGQAIGSTNRLGEVPKDRPVHIQQVFATVYHQLGIDVDTKLIDPNGRPQYLVEERELIHELI